MALLGFRHLSSKIAKGSTAKKSGRGGSSGGGGSGISGFTDAQAVSLYMSSLGKNPSLGDLNAVQDKIRQLPSQEAQIAVVKLEAQKSDFAQKVSLLQEGVNKTDSSLKASLNQVAAQSFNNPYALSKNYAEQYGLAIEDIQNQTDALIASGDATKADIETLNKQKSEYMDKVKHYNDFASSYYNVNSKGKIGPEDPTDYAYVAETNPATGKFSSVDIVRTADLKSGYMLTDMPVQTLNGQGEGIKIAVPTHQIGVTADGKPKMGAQVGRITFSQVESPNKAGTGTVLSPDIRAVEGDQGWFGEKKDAQGNPISQVNATIRDARQKGLQLGDSNHYGFDSSDPGAGTVTQVGSRMFYKTDKGSIMEIQPDKAKLASLGGSATLKDIMESKRDVLANYLQNNGQDGQTIANTLDRIHYQTPDFISQVDPNNYINPDSFKIAPPPSAAPQQIGTPPVKQENWVAKSAGGLAETASKFFSGRAAAANKPDLAAESSNGILNPPDILAKGAAFFAGKPNLP